MSCLKIRVRNRPRLQRKKDGPWTALAWSELSVLEHEVPIIQSRDVESLVQAEAQGRIAAFTIAIVPAIVSMGLSANAI